MTTVQAHADPTTAAGADAFELAAGGYDDVAASRLGRLLRARVHETLAPMVGPGVVVVDLGCGTGLDAAWCRARGAAVVAVDRSPEMVERTRRRLAADGLVAPRVAVADVDDADGLVTTLLELLDGRRADVVLADFGVWNCLTAPSSLAGVMYRVTRPGAVAVVVPMGRRVPWEWLGGLRHRDPERLGRRRRLRRAEADRAGYPDAATLAADLAPFGSIRSNHALGLALPTHELRHLVEGRAGLAAWLDRLDRRLGSSGTAQAWGDHRLVVVDRRVDDTTPAPVQETPTWPATWRLTHPGTDTMVPTTVDGLPDLPSADGVLHALRPERRAHIETFATAYESSRAGEGRGAPEPGWYRRLPDVADDDPFVDQWRQRSRSTERLRALLGATPQRIVEVGAGNGWLAARLTADGHDVLATDVNVGDVDGLAALRHQAVAVPAVRAEADALPLPADDVDVVLAAAAAHYLDADRLLAEAARVLRPGGRLLVVDSPLYADPAAGRAMAEAQLARLRAEGLTAPDLDGPGHLDEPSLRSAAARHGFRLDRLDLDGGRLRALRRRVTQRRLGREVARLPLLVLTLTEEVRP